jgi:hypothetical protein
VPIANRRINDALLQRRRGRNPMNRSAARTSPVRGHRLAGFTEALVAFVETVTVADAGEPGEICACWGLTLQVGARLAGVVPPDVTLQVRVAVPE